MSRLSNTIWLVALGGMTWLAMPADVAFGSIAADWDANEVALKSMADLGAGSSSSSSSSESERPWQPVEEPVPVDKLAAALPTDGGTSSSSGSSQTSNGNSASLFSASAIQYSPDDSRISWLTAEFSARLPEPLANGIFHPPRAVQR